jgi:hypothetical protein
MPTTSTRREEYRPGPTVPLGPTRAERDWMTRGACAQPGIDPDLFTCEETDTAKIQAARAICRGGACPVRLWCRLYAEETNPFGVYDGETYTERTRRLRRRRESVA